MYAIIIRDRNGDYYREMQPNRPTLAALENYEWGYRNYEKGGGPSRGEELNAAVISVYEVAE